MKDNKNILLAVISGIVACIVCIGVVVLFPKDKDLKGADEPILGDTCGTSYSSWQGGTWGSWVCSPGGLTTTAPTDSTNGTTYTQYENIDNTQGCYAADSSLGTTCSACHREKNWTRTASTGCTACSPGKYLDGDQCKTCPNGQYSEDGDLCWNCPAGYESTDINGSVGATSQSGCYTYVLAGYYIPTANGSKQKCPVGSYNSNTSQKVHYGETTSCTPCPNGQTTDDTGATNSSQCHAAATPEPTPFNCNGLGISECNSGAATSYCSWCNGGCHEKSVCSATPTPTLVPSPTPTIADLGLCNDGAIMYQYSSCVVRDGQQCRLNDGDWHYEGQLIVDRVTGQMHLNCREMTTTNPTPTPTPVPTTPAPVITPAPTTPAPSTTGNQTGTCTVPNTYWNGTECITCATGFIATPEIQRCHFVVPAGSYYDPANGSTTISTCPANTYSSGGIYYAADNTNPTALTSCTPCPSGTRSPMGSTSKSVCVAATGTCTLTVTTTATVVSPNTTSCPNDNRYPDAWTVKVKATGDGCNGATLSMSATGAERSGSSGDHQLSDGATFNIIYRSTTCCSKSTVTATAKKDNITIAQDSVSVSTSRGWRLSQHSTDENPVCASLSDFNANPHSAKEADDAGKDIYYIALDNTHCSGQREVDVYERGCNPTGHSTKYNFCCAKDDGTNYTWYSNQSSMKCPTGYTVDNSKNENTCKTVTIPACYKDSDNNYHWTDNPSTSWQLVPNVSREADCQENETPACYVDGTGEYKWGPYAKTAGYTKVTAIETEELCHKPEPNEACYKNNDNDYVWTATPPAGYTVVEGVTKPEDCAYENPACYVHGSEFIWGKYANVNGYIILEGIDSEDECKVPTNEACYKDKDGNYAWGEYSNDEGFTLVPEAKTMSQCGPDVPTPSTGLDTSRVVYIFMAILMAFGIGFIYYSSIMKKEN